MSSPLITFPFDTEETFDEMKPAIFCKEWAMFFETLSDALTEVIDFVEINAIFDA